MRELLEVRTLKDWLRVGHGKCFRFRYGGVDLTQVLGESLLSEYAPYSLVYVTSVEVSKRKYRWDAHTARLTELVDLRMRGITDLYIRSEVITPEMDFSIAEFPDALCSLNGLIHVQHGEMLKGVLQDSAISIVHKVASRSGDRVVEHTEYLKVFQALKKSLRPYKIMES